MKNKNKKIIFFSFLAAIVFSLALFQLALASVPLEDPLGLNKGLEEAMPDLAGRIINSLLGVIGAIALIIFIYGGATLLTSAGRSDWIKRGWDIITWSVIGLITVFISYISLNFILEGLKGASEEVASFSCSQTSGQTCDKGGICATGKIQGIGSCEDGYICCKSESAASSQESCASQQQPTAGVGPCEGCWNPASATFIGAVKGGQNGWVKLSGKTCSGNYECWKCVGTLANGPGCADGFLKRDCP